MRPNDFQLFGYLKKHLPGTLFATDADVKQGVTAGYRHLTPISCTPDNSWCCGGTNACTSVLPTWRSYLYYLLSMSHVYSEVRIKSLVSECLLDYFFKLLCLYVCWWVCVAMLCILCWRRTALFVFTVFSYDKTWPHTQVTRCIIVTNNTALPTCFPVWRLCVSQDVLYIILCHFFKRIYTVMNLCSIFFTLRIKLVERHSQTASFFFFLISLACELPFHDSHKWI